MTRIEKYYYPEVYLTMGLSKKGLIQFVCGYIAKNHPGYKVIKFDKTYAYCVKKEKKGEK